MCLIFIAHQAHSDYPLVVAANRDESHQRRTQAAQFWTDEPELLAGRDLEAQGTWMGVHRGSGRFAAITNYRGPSVNLTNPPSRGSLVSSFLRGSDRALDFLQRLSDQGSQYNGFSLLVHDGKTLASYCNREGQPQELSPGVYGLSNRVVNTPWPKVVSGRQELSTQLAEGPPNSQDLFAILTNRQPAADSELPETGIGKEREKQLSPRFILGDEYGTRSSTILIINQHGHAQFDERSYDTDGSLHTEVNFTFDLNVTQ